MSEIEKRSEDEELIEVLIGTDNQLALAKHVLSALYALGVQLIGEFPASKLEKPFLSKYDVPRIYPRKPQSDPSTDSLCAVNQGVREEIRCLLLRKRRQ